MKTMIDILRLQENDLVYSEQYEGCGLIGQYVHSYDTEIFCSYVWNEKKGEMYHGVYVYLDEIREPSYEEVCEFLRNFIPMVEI